METFQVVLGNVENIAVPALAALIRVYTVAERDSRHPRALYKQPKREQQEGRRRSWMKLDRRRLSNPIKSTCRSITCFF